MKTITTISIDSYLIELVRSKQEFNLSKFINDSLKTYFETMNDIKIDQSKTIEEIEKKIKDSILEVNSLKQQKITLEKEIEEQKKKQNEKLKGWSSWSQKQKLI